MSHDEGSSSSTLSHRQSVGWFADRAADAGAEVQRLPSTTEEEEGEDGPLDIPSIHIHEASTESTPDPMADIDKTISAS